MRPALRLLNLKRWGFEELSALGRRRDKVFEPDGAFFMS
jgi:hypothetical protein